MQGKNRIEMKNLLGIRKQVDNGEFEAVHFNVTTVCNNILKDSKANSGGQEGDEVSNVAVLMMQMVLFHKPLYICGTTSPQPLFSRTFTTGSNSSANADCLT